MSASDAAPIRIGLLRLSDSAPVLLAEASGAFAQHGLDVQIVVEPSWANIADKLAYGLLDAAVMPPPLALAAAAGLRGMPSGLAVAMGLSLGGNAVVLGGDAAAALRGATEGGPLSAAGARGAGPARSGDRPAPHGDGGSRRSAPAARHRQR
ncbi:MAG TPA: ABC transporter substrate-binding protein, partial [Acetobacteraceae bacterium]|nr:ABC transporter substrate-binding protein [Acetobacteraceae bacterium]